MTLQIYLQVDPNYNSKMCNIMTEPPLLLFFQTYLAVYSHYIIYIVSFLASVLLTLLLTSLCSKPSGVLLALCAIVLSWSGCEKHHRRERKRKRCRVEE